MEPLWYFLTRATGTLLPLLLLAYGAGLWTGWIKWHTWKKDYTEVERDYHKLHDIHDIARATIPELESRRAALTGEIGELEDLLGKFKQANESYEAESFRLNESLRATKRNYEALEEIWRNKLTQADLRITQLEVQLQATSSAASAPSSAEPRLIPFPPAAASDLPELPELDLEGAPSTNSAGKPRPRRAI